MVFETHHRSLLKAVTYRILGTAFSIVTVYTLTGKIETAMAFGGVEVLGKLALNYFHERLWSHVGYGRVTHGSLIKQ